MKKHRELSMRMQETSPMSMAKSFSPKSVSEFFDIFKKEVEKLNNDLQRFFNVDETGITIVQSHISKVIILKKGRKVFAL